MNAPIAIFAYKRPNHLLRLLRSLELNPESARSDLFVFCDGARSQDDVESVVAVREAAEALAGFSSVTKCFEKRNLGLASSIISGVTQVLRSHEKVIVLEDDLVLSPHFLKFMNEALNTYAAEKEVGSICGYFYPVQGLLPETFFLREADCWGWATWRRGWELFSPDGKALLEEIERRGLSEKFDVGGSYPYTQMLRDQINGKNSSWAIRWQASLFLAEKLTLYPGRSLVQNLGFDGSGEHCGSSEEYKVELSPSPVLVSAIPIEVSETVKEAAANYFRKNMHPQKVSAFLRIRHLGSRFLGRLTKVIGA